VDNYVNDDDDEDDDDGIQFNSVLIYLRAKLATQRPFTK
jgi:hypothetical protein